MSSDFLEEINERLAAIDLADCQEPDDDLAPNAVVVGTLNEAHIRLRGLSNQYMQEARALANRAAAVLQAEGPDSQTFHELDSQRELVGKKASIVRDLFWMSVIQYYHGLDGHGTVFVAKGWQVGYIDNPDEPKSPADHAWFQHLAAKRRARRGLVYILIGVVGLAGLVAITALLAAGRTQASLLGAAVFALALGLAYLFRK